MVSHYGFLRDLGYLNPPLHGALAIRANPLLERYGNGYLHPGLNLDHLISQIQSAKR